jgi:hypothetical protein
LRPGKSLLISTQCWVMLLPALAQDKPEAQSKPEFQSKPGSQNKKKSPTASRAVVLPPSTKTIPALVLHQKHIYLGETKVSLTPNAVRMDCLGKLHFSFISKAPRWDITVFRTDDRLYFTQSFGEFCDQGLYSNIVMTMHDRMLPKGGRLSKGKVSGFAVQQVSWPTLKFACLESKGYAPQVERVLHAAYKVPNQGQIPIQYEVILSGRDWMTNLTEKGIKRSMLSTKKISRESVPASEFQVPSGLAKSKSVTRIVVGSTKKMNDTGVNVLFDGIGER